MVYAFADNAKVSAHDIKPRGYQPRTFRRVEAFSSKATGSLLSRRRMRWGPWLFCQKAHPNAAQELSWRLARMHADIFDLLETILDVVCPAPPLGHRTRVKLPSPRAGSPLVPSCPLFVPLVSQSHARHIHTRYPSPKPLMHESLSLMKL